MIKEKRIKLLTIILLAITLLTLTIGFAAFSTTLNISSSATVRPNEEDFKIIIYGFKDEIAVNNYVKNRSFSEIDLSTSTAFPYIKQEETITAEEAEINNSMHRISNIKVNLTSSEQEIIYYFIIKNEGKYDAYLDLTNYEYDSNNKEYSLNPPITGTCIPEIETTKELVDNTCENITHVLNVSNSNNSQITTGESVLTIPKGSHIVLASIISYSKTENLADGPFSVEFPTLTLSFSTTK